MIKFLTHTTIDICSFLATFHQLCPLQLELDGLAITSSNCYSFQTITLHVIQSIWYASVISEQFICVLTLADIIMESLNLYLSKCWNVWIIPWPLCLCAKHHPSFFLVGIYHVTKSWNTYCYQRLSHSSTKHGKRSITLTQTVFHAIGFWSCSKNSRHTW